MGCTEDLQAARQKGQCLSAWEVPLLWKQEGRGLPLRIPGPQKVWKMYVLHVIKCDEIYVIINVQIRNVSGNTYLKG